MSDWKSKLNFGEPTCVTCKVGESDIDFYPVSVGMMFKLRRLAKPLAQAISVLTAGGAKDTGQIYRQVGDPVRDADGKPIIVGEGDSATTIRDTETIAEAITPELAELRSKQKTEAVESLVSACMDEDNLVIIGSIIMDSMRIPNADRPPAKEFINSIPTDKLPDLILGVGKANKGVFGPLAGKLSPLFTRAQQALDERLSDENEEQSKSERSETSSEILEEIGEQK